MAIITKKEQQIINQGGSLENIKTKLNSKPLIEPITNPELRTGFNCRSYKPSWSEICLDEGFCSFDGDPNANDAWRCDNLNEDECLTSPYNCIYGCDNVGLSSFWDTHNRPNSYMNAESGEYQYQTGLIQLAIGGYDIYHPSNVENINQCECITIVEYLDTTYGGYFDKGLLEEVFGSHCMYNIHGYSDIYGDLYHPVDENILHQSNLISCEFTDPNFIPDEQIELPPICDEIDNYTTNDWHNLWNLPGGCSDIPEIGFICELGVTYGTWIQYSNAVLNSNEYITTCPNIEIPTNCNDFNDTILNSVGLEREGAILTCLSEDICTLKHQVSEYLGCTDNTACNYNPLANTDDDSCTYPEMYFDCDGNPINDSDNDGIPDELDQCEGDVDPIQCLDGTIVCPPNECPIYGCPDQSACNYVENANSCLPVVKICFYGGGDSSSCHNCNAADFYNYYGGYETYDECMNNPDNKEAYDGCNQCIENNFCQFGESGLKATGLNAEFGSGPWNGFPAPTTNVYAHNFCRGVLGYEQYIPQSGISTSENIGNGYGSSANNGDTNQCGNWGSNESDNWVISMECLIGDVDLSCCEYPEENYDCDGNCRVELDCAGVCGGPGLLDECGECGGNGVVQECGCGTPGEFEMPEGACDCAGNVIDDCGVCGGGGIQPGTCNCGGDTTEKICGSPYRDCWNDCACFEDKDDDKICDQEDDCVGILDNCGICNGENYFDENGLLPSGACNCDGGFYDSCSVCGGNGPSFNCEEYIGSAGINLYGCTEEDCYEVEAVTEPPITGCTYLEATNYNPEAEDDDGSCVFNLLKEGCMDNTSTHHPTVGYELYLGESVGACNYDPTANVPSSEAYCSDSLILVDLVNCVYPLEFKDCDGNCINDDDLDGICNEQPDDCWGTYDDFGDCCPIGIEIDECGLCDGDGKIECLDGTITCPQYQQENCPDCVSHNQCPEGQFCDSGWDGSEYGIRRCTQYAPGYCNAWGSTCGVAEGEIFGDPCENSDDCSIMNGGDGSSCIPSWLNCGNDFYDNIFYENEPSCCYKPQALLPDTVTYDVGIINRGHELYCGNFGTNGVYPVLDICEDSEFIKPFGASSENDLIATASRICTVLGHVSLESYNSINVVNSVITNSYFGTYDYVTWTGDEWVDVDCGYGTWDYGNAAALIANPDSANDCYPGSDLEVAQTTFDGCEVGNDVDLFYEWVSVIDTKCHHHLTKVTCNIYHVLNLPQVCLIDSGDIYWYHQWADAGFEESGFSLPDYVANEQSVCEDFPGWEG